MTNPKNAPPHDPLAEIQELYAAYLDIARVTELTIEHHEPVHHDVLIGEYGQEPLTLSFNGQRG